MFFVVLHEVKYWSNRKHFSLTRKPQRMTEWHSPLKPPIGDWGMDIWIVGGTCTTMATESPTTIFFFLPYVWYLNLVQLVHLIEFSFIFSLYSGCEWGNLDCLWWWGWRWNLDRQWIFPIEILGAFCIKCLKMFFRWFLGMQPKTSL